MSGDPIQAMSGAPFLPDMAEYGTVAEAQADLTAAGEDDRKLAAWARKYGQPAVDRCDETVGIEYGEPGED